MCQLTGKCKAITASAKITTTRSSSLTQG